MLKKISRLTLLILSTLIISCPIQYTFWADSIRWLWKIVWVKWIDVYGTNDYQEDSLIHTIRKAINWVLWLLAFVCLCLTLYAGFLMLTSGWDSKKFWEWFSIIKNAAIWLAIIAVSWLIVSLIFYVINTAVVTEA